MVFGGLFGARSLGFGIIGSYRVLRGFSAEKAGTSGVQSCLGHGCVKPPTLHPRNPPKPPS